MKNLKELLRVILTTPLSNQQLGKLNGVSPTTVQRYRLRLIEEDLDWSMVSALDDASLDARLNDKRSQRKARFVEPDWSAVYADYQRIGVTLSLLHEEYAHGLTSGVMSESEFRRRYDRYQRSRGLVMRQIHRPGEELFVDYSGKRPSITDPLTGVKTPVELFVASMGASRQIYAEATASQRLPDWIGSHVRAFDFYGGVPTMLVPDNLKSAVTRTTRAEGALLNPTFSRFAEHYGVFAVPARGRRPKDKALVEVSVKIAQRWILGRLRNRTFFSLAELNTAIAEQMTQLNHRPMRKLGGKTRQQLFDELDVPALKPLPAERYEYAEWHIGIRVGADYHVAWEKRYYSVPYTLISAKVDLRVTADGIAVYHRNKRIASHAKLPAEGDVSTLREHQPRSHQMYSRDQAADLLAWAETAGASVAQFIQRHIEQHRRPLASLQALRGLKTLARDYGVDRLDAACARALAMHSCSVSSVRSMLKRQLENKPLSGDATTAVAVHENVRGSRYFH